MRQSNIELCRVVAILFVITVHSSFYTLGIPTTVGNCIIPSLFIQAFSIIGVNLFILITGYFSTIPKKSSIINILFICLFYAIINIIYNFTTKGFNNDTFHSLFFVSYSNWFVISYLGLMFIAPVLNTYAVNAERKSYRYLLLTLIAFQFWFGCYPAYPLYNVGNHFGWGYSTISFSILYLLARYFQKYGFPELLTISKDVFFYVGTSLLIAFIAYMLIKTGHASNLRMTQLYAYCNPLVIFSSVCIFHFFSQLQMGGVKIVNHLAKSSLGILLFHLSAPIDKHLRIIYQGIYTHSDTLWVLIPKLTLSIFAVYLISLGIDQVRLILYSFFKERIK